jgi:hypothetical protein
MVKALLDNGMFTADTAAVIQVDATADTDGHVGTTLVQLNEIGADKVVVADSQTTAYIDVGNVTDADALGTLVDSLAAGEGQASLVTNTQGTAVTTALVLDSQTQATIVSLLDGSSDAATTLVDKLATIGITHVYVADNSGSLVIGLDQEHHYRDLLATG